MKINPSHYGKTIFRDRFGNQKLIINIKLTLLNATCNLAKNLDKKKIIIMK